MMAELGLDRMDTGEVEMDPKWLRVCVCVCVCVVCVCVYKLKG